MISGRVPFCLLIFLTLMSRSLTYCLLTQNLGVTLDDLAILTPSSRALKALLVTCVAFATRNHIKLRVAKSVVLLILPKTSILVTKPNIYLGKSIISYIDSFKHLGLILTAVLTANEDIDSKNKT